jgi:hypothetical protein
VRLLWGPGARVHVQQRYGQPLPEADLGAIVGPDRHPHRGAAGGGDSASRWKSCRTTGWARPRARSGSGWRRRGTGRRRALQGRGCWPTRIWGRGRCGTFAGWTTSQLSWDREEPALLASEPAAMQQLHMSARAYHRILKLARTMARKAGLGSDRQRRDPDGAFGGGDPVSAATADVTYTRQSEHC